MPAEAPLRVIIVDDEAMARQRLCRLLGCDPDIDIVAECADGAEAVNVLLDTAADLLFLDVQMPGMDGFAVLRAVPSERIPVVVFVTAYDSYAIQAFEASAVDYLLKPFHRARFTQALERAKSQVFLRGLDRARRRIRDLAQAQRDSRLVVRSGRSILLLPHDEIDWIEAAGNYVCVHCGVETHIARETLAGIEERIESGQFIRIHRSAIVNSKRVREIRPAYNGDYRVFLKDGTRLTLSRTYGDKLEVLVRNSFPG
jgi:two-component system LytT family response regulator